MTDELYLNYKLIIKKWEKKFKETEKRNPIKEDIKKAPSSVKDAYKEYWYLKTSFLEEAIVKDELFIPQKLPKASDVCVAKENLDNIDVSAVSSSKSDEVTSQQVESTEDNQSASHSDINTPEFINTKSVWGDHLKRIVDSAKENCSKKSTSNQFTDKLFKGLKLKKRNPRKFKKMSEKSKLFDSAPLLSSDDSQSVSDINSCPVQSLEASSIDKNIFDIPSSVRITGGKSLNSVQSVNIFNLSADFPNIRPRALKNKIDEGWLERCEKQCNLVVDASEINLSNIESTNEVMRASNFTFTSKDSVNTIPSSDEDYVYSSEDDAHESYRVAITENSSVAACNTSSDCGISKKKEDTSTIIAKSTDSALSNKMIDPVSAAKNLINSCMDVYVGVKRSAGNDLCYPEKKRKTSTDYDSERKLKQLEKKVASGKANENFVSIDIKRKKFVRGKKSMTYSTYKKQNWKMKKKVASMGSINITGGVLKCYKCGDVGHYSKQCKKKNVLLPIEELSDIEDSPFPTLEEAAEMAKAKKTSDSKSSEVIQMLEMCDSIAEPNLEENLTSVPFLCDYNNEKSVKDNTACLYEALKKFGYDMFRSGQEKAMIRIISGKSTLFVSSTGSGKSLCYQIPAYLYSQHYKCVSLVISPLVSLMEDQVLNFPSFLRAACLHTNQTAQQRNQVIENVKNNKVSVLLISPESMISGEHGILGHSLIQHFPPVAFVCIDEVHCVSQWSHNFRTSYLMICRVLKERFKVRTFLGITATATMSTVNHVTEHLGIPRNEIADAVLQHIVLPDNLLLSVSKDENRDVALVRLLKQPPFSEFDSIIIYCLRRNECERVASFLRCSLEDRKKPIQMYGERGAISADVEVYHAGLSAARRKKVQNYFMKGKIRIVVATVAFGMGINKADIRGIIHYNMPRTFEHYVQEIGRAGRDGLLARCHLFYDPMGNDLPELKRHIFSDSVDRYVIRKLLQKVFQPCSCTDVCEKHEVAFSVESTVQALDLSQESISTLLCYLELLPDHNVKVLPPAYTIGVVQSFGGAKALQEAAVKCPPLAYAIAEHCKNTDSSKISSKFEFDVIALAEKIKWKSGVVKNELKRCEWKKVNDKFKKTAINVTFGEIGFHVQSPGNLTGEELDYALDALHGRVVSQENTALDQLEICKKAFETAAYDNVEDSLSSDVLNERNIVLKLKIGEYFREENHECSRKIETELKDKSTVMCNIHRLVSSCRDTNFTGRAVARIFHGIESPNYPAIAWHKTPFWRCGLNEDFNVLCRFASHELLQLR